MAENFTEEIKVRLSVAQKAALERAARRRSSKTATLAREAIQNYLLEHDDPYRVMEEDAEGGYRAVPKASAG